MIKAINIRLARLNAGDKSQAAAGARLGVSGKTWFLWERDDSMPLAMYTLYLALTGQHPDAPGVFLKMVESGV